MKALSRTPLSEKERLIVDPEFRDLLPPHSKEEYEILEKTVVEEGRIRETFKRWKGTDILLDGMTRYRIRRKHPGIEVEIEDIELPSREACKEWIIKTQIGRRNLNESQRAKVAEKLEQIYRESARQRQIEGGKKKGKAQMREADKAQLRRRQHVI